MGEKARSVRLREKEILARNNKVDARIVSAQARLERELGELGVEVKPEFKLEPPLGRGRTRLYGRNF